MCVCSRTPLLYFSMSLQRQVLRCNFGQKKERKKKDGICPVGSTGSQVVLSLLNNYALPAISKKQVGLSIRHNRLWFKLSLANRKMGP